MLKNHMETKGYANFLNSWVTWNVSPQENQTPFYSLWNMSLYDNWTYQKDFVTIEISQSSGGNGIMGYQRHMNYNETTTPPSNSQK